MELSETFQLALLEWAIEKGHDDAWLGEQEQRLAAWLASSSSWHGTKQSEGVLLKRFFRGDHTPYAEEEQQERARDAFHRVRLHVERRVQALDALDTPTAKEASESAVLRTVYGKIERPSYAWRSLPSDLEREKRAWKSCMESAVSMHDFLSTYKGEWRKNNMREALTELCLDCSSISQGSHYGSSGYNTYEESVVGYYPPSLEEDYEGLYAWALEFFQAAIECLEGLLQEAQGSKEAL